MATLKVGDRVEFTVDGKPQAGTITRVYDGAHEMYDVKVGAKTLIVTDTPMTKTNACRNALKVGDKVTYWVFDKKVNGTIKAIRGNRVEVDDGVTFPLKDLEAWNACRNAVVANALNGCARNAGIWESTEEAEDRSDVFVRAALGRTKYNFDGEAQTLREVIKLLASAEQTPKIKKNTEKLKGILSRVEKAAALFKGI